MYEQKEITELKQLEIRNYKIKIVNTIKKIKLAVNAMICLTKCYNIYKIFKNH